MSHPPYTYTVRKYTNAAYALQDASENPLSGIKAWVPVLRRLKHSVLTKHSIVPKRFDEIRQELAHTLNITWRSYVSNQLP